MTQRNSLMEWLEQTRRINKSVDIICMETIDGVIDVLPYIKRSTVYKNRKFFNTFCDYYHKDNPLDLFKKMKKSKSFECGACQTLSDFAQGSINRCWGGLDMVRIQWLEVIDLLWERPELVNPALVDDYIRNRVLEVCKEKNKRNPLAPDGMWEHFGKHWRDKKGLWRDERRKRF